MRKTTLLVFSGLVHSILAYYFHWVLSLLILSFYYAGGLLGIIEADHKGEVQLDIILFLITILAIATYFLIIFFVNRILINGASMRKRSCLLFNGFIFVTISLIRSIPFFYERFH